MSQELYDIEDRARGLDSAARLELRQNESTLVWQWMCESLDSEVVRKLLPKDAMSGSIGYINNHWNALQVYAYRQPLSRHRRRFDHSGDRTTFLNNRVTAHKGNSGEFPESTMPTFQSGTDVSADRIELDILGTKDSQPVVIHDQTTTNHLFDLS